MKAVLFCFKNHLPFEKSDAEQSSLEGSSGFLRHPAKSEDCGRKKILYKICKNDGKYTSNLIPFIELLSFKSFFFGWSYFFKRNKGVYSHVHLSKI